MTLCLTLRQTTSIPLEVEGITPDVLRAKSLAEIEQSEMFHGNVKLPLAEFFTVTGDPSNEVVEWEGDLKGVHWIGAKMTSGCMRINGSAGRHVGSEMRGGEIHVLGNVSDWLGGEMHGGLIHVRGNAGHLVGAAYRGSARGMTKGTILVGGNAGNEIGHTLRRGLIAIAGDAGDLAGVSMLAGTIVLLGNSGIRHGASMKRGTIAFCGDQRPPMLPSFRRACRFQPEALKLIGRHLKTLDFQAPLDRLYDPCELYNGDLIEGGRGEILLRAI
jgi:formylmethanofuran dehydrogenase subunit C